MNNYVIADSKGWFSLKKLSHSFNKDKFHLIKEKKDLNFNKLRALNPKFIFFLHWNWKVNSEIHERYNCIVFHTAPLPYGRGGSPIQNLILLGFESSPVCALKMTNKLDAGPIYMKKELSLKGSLSEIFKRLKYLTEEMIQEICISKELKLSLQNDKDAFYFNRLKKENNKIDFSYPLEKIYDQIRMVDGLDYPRAFIELGKYIIEFTEAEKIKDEISAVVKITNKTKKSNQKIRQNFLKFVEVNNSSIIHINFLFDLLKNRKFSISHKEMPSLEEHKYFIKNHPYIKWYLIKKSNSFIGSVYIMKDNCIGLDLKKGETSYTKEIINYVKNNHKPLPAIKSVRNSKFFINVNAYDFEKINSILDSGATHLQSTYII